MDEDELKNENNHLKNVNRVLVEDYNNFKQIHHNLRLDHYGTARIFRYIINIGVTLQTIIMAIALYHFW